MESFSQSGQYHTGDCFALVREMKYFVTGQYRCTASGLPLYIYIYKLLNISDKTSFFH
jgi:hypothetical protein